MKDDFLGQYGSEPKSGGRATNGGQMTPKPMPYSPPKGPSDQKHKGPGIGGTNHGKCGTQGRY